MTTTSGWSAFKTLAATETPATSAVVTLPPWATAEQTAAVEAFVLGDNLVLEAGAGTGKTSTLRLLGENTKSKGVYIAYNKAIATEAASKFTANVTCKTAHAFAYGAVGYTFRDRLNAERPKPWNVAKFLGIHHREAFGDKVFSENTLVRLVMEMVANFCNSADSEIRMAHRPYVEALLQTDSHGNRHDMHPLLAQYLLPYAQKAWDNILDPEARAVQFTHDHYLKIWQLGSPVLPGDFVLFDEAQDANPVVADVVLGQDSQLVFVGDRAQAIYGWRGAVDAMSTFPADQRLLLSQSFRFGPALAEEANRWLSALPYDLRLSGTDSIVTEVGEFPDAKAVLCRGNAGSIDVLLRGLEDGQKVHLVGGATDVQSFCRGAIDLQTKGSSSHRDLLGFESWDQVREHVKEERQGDLATWVGILDRFTPQAVLQALQSTVSEEAADIVVSTAHKAKGREWDSVRIHTDFEQKTDKAGQPIPLNDAEIMLRYVAVTRAQYALDRGPLASWNPLANL